MPNTILERIAIHSGKTFIYAKENNTNSYIIQEGEVQSYIIENGIKLIIDCYTSGSIIAEKNLLLDEREDVNYETTKDSTVIKITRQDFEKKIKKLDSTLMNIILHLIRKLKDQENRWVEHITQSKKNDMKAMEIVGYLLRDMTNERKTRYEEILLPHFNIMVKALEELKGEERKTKQKQDLEDSVTRATQHEEPSD